MTQDPLNAEPGPARFPEREPESPPPGASGATALSNGSSGKDAATIRRMFAAIAPRYDLLNHLLSGGLDLYWRRAAVGVLLDQLSPRAETNGHAGRPSGAVSAGRRVLDLCAGTLDLACALADSRRFPGKTLALDFALPMLRRGRRKLGGRRARQILPLCGDGLRLPFRDGSFEAVMVAFGVRNFEDLDRGLAEAHRVLAPGGLLLVLEFSRPENAVFRSLYQLYSRRVLPRVGGAISGHASAYRYLPASVAEFPDARGLARCLEQAGYERVRFRMLTGGIVALHEASKPKARVVEHDPRLSLRVLAERYAVCRLGPDDAVPPGLLDGRIVSVTRTLEELSVVCPERHAPDGLKSERGFRCLQVVGPLDFALTGVLASLTAPLAAAGISVFVLSTFDTDYLLIRERDLETAAAVLTRHGHRILE